MTFLPAGEDAKLEIAEISNHLSGLFNELQDFREKIKAMPAEFLELQFGDKKILSAGIPEKDAWVTVIGEANINTGFIRLELRKLVKKVKPLIG
jgi:hypothetical protein